MHGIAQAQGMMGSYAQTGIMDGYDVGISATQQYQDISDARHGVELLASAQKDVAHGDGTGWTAQTQTTSLQSEAGVSEDRASGQQY